MNRKVSDFASEAKSLIAGDVQLQQLLDRASQQVSTWGGILCVAVLALRGLSGFLLIMVSGRVACRAENRWTFTTRKMGKTIAVQPVNCSND